MLNIWRCLKRIRCRTLLIILIFPLLTLLLLDLLRYECLDGHPRIVWWTQQFPGTRSKLLKCGANTCEFTNDRRFKDKAAGFLFYGSDFDMFDLPLPRRQREVVWGLLHEESPRNTPILSHKPALELFNYSSTVSRFSHVPLTLQYLDSIDNLTNPTYFVGTDVKNEYLTEIAPVLFMQSDCDTSSYREDYVKELMKYIPIDSYGKCLNNRKLPERLSVDYLNRLYGDEILRFVGRYKFTIAIENGVCEDYITEKLWRPLIVGSVPIYLGSPTVEDWLPFKNSVIFVDNFKSPQHLAAFINSINSDNVKYEQYLLHKTQKMITNPRLVETLRRKHSDDMLTVQEFECHVCNAVHDNSGRISIVNQSHYDCKEPIPPLDDVPSNFWHDVWKQSKSSAILLKQIVIDEQCKNFTAEQFYDRLSFDI